MWWHRDAGRPLTSGERQLTREIFGDAVDCDRVRIHRASWFPFQPRNVAMAPDGDLWLHPEGHLWRDDYAEASTAMQALFVHELTHIWQHQQGICILLRRYPFSRYSYRLVADKALRRYGIEQQATIVEHAFLARKTGQPNPHLEVVVGRAGLSHVSG